MGVLELEGYSVKFPHQPYDCQLVFMQKVLQALEVW
jgi:hypothetical protein